MITLAVGVLLSICIAVPAIADCSTDSPPTCTYISAGATATVTPTAFTPSLPAFCKKITNNSGQDIMVPMGSKGEWEGDTVNGVAVIGFLNSDFATTSGLIVLDDCDVYAAINPVYGSCTAACGGGTCTQTLKSWTCQQNDKTTGTVKNLATTTACTNAGVTPPATQTYTNNSPCYTGTWTAGTCSATCGGGTIGAPTCSGGNGQCDPATAPASGGTCNTQACDPCASGNCHYCLGGYNCSNSSTHSCFDGPSYLANGGTFPQPAGFSALGYLTYINKNPCTNLGYKCYVAPHNAWYFQCVAD